MKLITSLFITLIAATRLAAQPTLTATDINPHAGERFYSYDCDTAGVSHGSAGAGVTWNFSSLANVFTDSVLYLDCAPTPYCDSFPGSTLAQDMGGAYEYFITDANQFSISGFGDPTAGMVYFTNPQAEIRYPITYGSTILDTFVYGQPADSVLSYGVDSLMGDAYGTLILPTGTFTNVLRVHLIMHETDSQYMASFTFLDSGRSEIYMWFKAGFHNPLLTMNYDTMDNAGVLYLSDVTYYNQLTALGATHMSEGSQAMSVYPNPAKDELHIVFTSEQGGQATATLTDLVSREAGTAKQYNINVGANNISYNISTLPPGVYLLKLREGERTVLKKIVKTE